MSDPFPLECVTPHPRKRMLCGICEQPALVSSVLASKFWETHGVDLAAWKLPAFYSVYLCDFGHLCGCDHRQRSDIAPAVPPPLLRVLMHAPVLHETLRQRMAMLRQLALPELNHVTFELEEFEFHGS